MKLTSMDITNKEFRKGMRGYNQEEVDEFLDKVSEDYEALFKENSVLKEKISAVDERLEYYAKMESTIQNTLLMAQNAAEQARQNSHAESELIIKYANDNAKKIIDKANNEVLYVNSEYEKTKQEFNKFRAKYRNFIRSQLDMFDDMEKELMKNFNIGRHISEKDVELIEASSSTAEAENSGSDYAGIAENIDEIKSFFEKED